MPPNSFVARLVDHAGAISGETVERCDDPEGHGGEIIAIFTGHRRGNEVVLEKRYDDLRRAGHVIHYSGQIGEEGHEIAGRWLIPGHWSGTFVMVRERGSEALVEARISETVR